MAIPLYQKLSSTLKVKDILCRAWLVMALRVEPKFLLVMQQGKMWFIPRLYLSWACSSYISFFLFSTTPFRFVFSWPCKSFRHLLHVSRWHVHRFGARWCFSLYFLVSPPLAIVIINMYLGRFSNMLHIICKWSLVKCIIFAVIHKIGFTIHFNFM